MSSDTSPVDPGWSLGVIETIRACCGRVSIPRTADR